MWDTHKERVHTVVHGTPKQHTKPNLIHQHLAREKHHRKNITFQIPKPRLDHKTNTKTWLKQKKVDL